MAQFSSLSRIYVMSYYSTNIIIALFQNKWRNFIFLAFIKEYIYMVNLWCKEYKESKARKISATLYILCFGGTHQSMLITQILMLSQTSNFDIELEYCSWSQLTSLVDILSTPGFNNAHTDQTVSNSRTRVSYIISSVVNSDTSSPNCDPYYPICVSSYFVRNTNKASDEYLDSHWNRFDLSANNKEKYSSIKQRARESSK